MRFRRGRELAIDLGTANTLVFVRGEGIRVFEPSVVAIDERTGDVHAVGEEARRMIGRTPASIRATRPLRHGVIADFDITAEMLRYFMRPVGGAGLSFSRVALCVPSGITAVERDAVEEATLGAGDGRVGEDRLRLRARARRRARNGRRRARPHYGAASQEAADVERGAVRD